VGLAALANGLFARAAERKTPATGKFVEVDGVRLHYIERGTGRPIILLHGNGTLAEDWVISGVLDQLAADHRVIALDRPGFGYSDRPRNRIWTAHAQAVLIRKALLKLDVHKPVVVGHSWGTLVALALALDGRLDPAALVLLSGYYFPTVRADVAVLSGPAIPLLGDVIRYTVSPALGWLLRKRITRKLFAPAPVSSRFRTRFPLPLALRPSQIRAGAADAVLMIPAAASLLDRHSELEMPVAIMAGKGDRVVDIGRQSRRLHAELPNSSLHELDGVGHMIHYTARDAVVAAIAAAAGAGAPNVRAKAGLASDFDATLPVLRRGPGATTGV
jgi:pimeloyl-ACP methyl ester carboxylesterase